MPRSKDKPVLASWMGGPAIAAGEAILNRANIPTFPFPDTAVRMFNYMWQYNCNLRSIYETPILPVDSTQETPDRARVDSIDQARAGRGRTILTEYEVEGGAGGVLHPNGEHHARADRR